MQNTPGIGAYLDAGSLKQFAGQAMEVLPGALSVAVFDVQGSIAWCGPGGGDNNLWSRISARDIVAADDDCCMDVPGTGFVYRFTLRRGRDKDAVGILAVLAGGDVRLSAFSAREEIADIIGCILKQLDIRMELSAVRQQSGRERKDMELLARLDDLRGQEGGASSLQEALCLTARHFDSDLVVMAIPDRGIHRAWRRDGVVNEQGCKAMSPILASLVAAAKDRRRVLIANAAGVIKRIAGIENQEAQILSSPVLAGGNEVAGVLGLVRAQKFSRFDVRLIRVVAARVAAFTEEADPSPRLPATRHDLLREIDRQLQSNPKASRALLLIDIDKLHVVNEMHGHFGGDAAIAGVISAAQKAGGDGAIVCNIGGGSIALYLP
ncbi:MAG: diguanylate cyclase, partial [Halioglobus sp.]|nr:diguanylate cyclase [Halioglobus sp.]